jgi:PAS domain S-box-containing protein
VIKGQAGDMNTAESIAESSGNSCINPEKVEELLSMQLSILEMIAKDMKTEQVLDELCYLSEKMLPNSVASIMLFDETRSHLNVRSAPSIPVDGVRYLNGLQPGPKSGSCGTAVFTGKPVFVENTQSDYRWFQFREFADRFNICSCWSMPIRTSSETVIGSFALTSFENRTPDYFHRSLLDAGAHLVAIIIERETQQQRLQLASIAFENINEGIIVADADRRIIEVNQAFTEITGYRTEDVIFKDPMKFSSRLEPAEFYEKFWLELETQGHWSGEVRNQRKKGDIFTEWLSVKCVYDEHGELTNYVAILSLRKHDVIARHGGDEFLVLVEDIEDPLELMHVTDHIRESLKKPIRITNHEFNISVSIGISTYPDNGLTRDSLLRNADVAMYEAKKNGRNRVAFYTRELTETVQAKVTLEGDLRKALNTKQISLNYQPQFSASSGALIGVEVLARWRHCWTGTN